LNFDITTIPTEDIKKTLADRLKIDLENKSRLKLEQLRKEAIEAVTNATAEMLPAVLALINSNKTRQAKTNLNPIKAVYRWDDALKKNRKVDLNGAFIEPAVFLKGPKAAIPLH
jgi:16S rRNA U1498 N3-methylase RsmE